MINVKVNGNNGTCASQANLGENCSSSGDDESCGRRKLCNEYK